MHNSNTTIQANVEDRTNFNRNNATKRSWVTFFLVVLFLSISGYIAFLLYSTNTRLDKMNSVLTLDAKDLETVGLELLNRITKLEKQIIKLQAKDKKLASRIWVTKKTTKANSAMGVQHANTLNNHETQLSQQAQQQDSTSKFLSTVTQKQAIHISNSISANKRLTSRVNKIDGFVKSTTRFRQNVNGNITNMEKQINLLESKVRKLNAATANKYKPINNKK